MFQPLTWSRSPLANAEKDGLTTMICRFLLFSRAQQRNKDNGLLTRVSGRGEGREAFCGATGFGAMVSPKNTLANEHNGPWIGLGDNSTQKALSIRKTPSCLLLTPVSSYTPNTMLVAKPVAPVVLFAGSREVRTVAGNMLKIVVTSFSQACDSMVCYSSRLWRHVEQLPRVSAHNNPNANPAVYVMLNNRRKLTDSVPQHKCRNGRGRLGR